MFLKSLIPIGRNLAPRTATQLGRDLFHARMFFAKSRVNQEQQQPAQSSTLDGDGHLYIEDNLKLDIKSSEDATIIDVKPVSTGREGKLVKVDHDQACALCRLNLNNLNYTDVMILNQFVKRNGSLVTYHESKLCSNQYRKVEKLIKQAQRCNLMPRPADYLVPGPWHDLNTYLEQDRKRDQPMKYVKKEYWKI